MIFQVCCLALVSLTHGAFDEGDEDLVRDLSSVMTNKELENEDDDEAADDIMKVFDAHGMSANAPLSPALATRLLVIKDKGKWAPFNFARQISCYQGKSTNLIFAGIYAYKKYNGYGCYCGGGEYHGNYLDATDLCCKHHDECYARAMKKYDLKAGCHTYTTKYSFTCCKKEKNTKCTDMGPSAGRDICECDQAMAKCVATSSTFATYNKIFKNDRSRCKAENGKHTKVYSSWDIIKTCKEAFKPKNKFTLTIQSQGKCSKRKFPWG